MPDQETLLDDDATNLVASLESLTLPFDQWSHCAHVKVAYIYLCRHPFEQALDKLRTAIQSYNAHNHVPESATSGYNETTTHAFLHLIAATRAAYSQTHPTPTADHFCDTHPQLMTRHALRLFYSPEQRMHPLAKTQFIPPDLAPLPTILSRSA
jgi:hypothetical protein